MTGYLSFPVDKKDKSQELKKALIKDISEPYEKLLSSRSVFRRVLLRRVNPLG